MRNILQTQDQHIVSERNNQLVLNSEILLPEAASNLGAVIGLTAGAIMALKREEREALEQEEYNEFIAEQKQRESLRMG